jgi:predicted nucleotidyltransferase
MNIDLLERLVAEFLAGKTEILFGYLHGSVLTSDDPNDVDIAVFLNPEHDRALWQAGRLHFDFVLPLEMELEKALEKPVDVQVLNRAPLSFRARVANQGRLIVERDGAARCDFECRARCEYFDFRPRRREYLAALGAP